jgi:hypothetical protein
MQQTSNKNGQICRIDERNSSNQKYCAYMPRVLATDVTALNYMAI